MAKFITPPFIQLLLKQRHSPIMKRFIINFKLRQCVRSVNFFLLLGMCVLFVPHGVSAETERELPRTSASRISEEIKLDGVLDEPIWQTVEPICQLYQIQPDQGEPAPQPSEVRILYDHKKLYFGFIFFDSEMDKLVANDMRRDSPGLRSNDYGFLLLDTYNDLRNAVFFRFTPVGGMEDTAVSNSGGNLNQNWDIVWECRCRINEDNWTVEIAIPFNQLRFERSDVMNWGLNFGREISRNQEIAAWNETPKTYGGLAKYRTAYFGTLEGLEGISPSRHLELLPYLLPGASYGSSTEETEGVFEGGLDFKYGVTSNLTADLTFNTDFAQVEADQEQVNLTRFSLFFPEQRPFFWKVPASSMWAFHVQVSVAPTFAALLYSAHRTCERTSDSYSRWEQNDRKNRTLRYRDFKRVDKRL